MQFDTGQIRQVALDRGVGWIFRDGARRDLFFSASELRGLEFDRTLVGRKVRFEVALTTRGYVARNVRSAAKASTDTQHGTVATLLLHRGFGFVRTSDGRDLYFHASDVAEEIEWDERLRYRRVRFQEVKVPQGAKAVNIRPARD